MRILFLLILLLFNSIAFAQFSNEKIIHLDEQSFPKAVFGADLDADGDLDVLSANTGAVVWYKNDGKGNFSNQIIISTEVETVISIHTADLDMDGDMDVLSASFEDDKIAWYENDGMGNFSEQRIVSTQLIRAVDVHAADLDADGDMDVLSASVRDNKIAWYENDGMGNFSESKVISRDAIMANEVNAADLDGDSDMDVLSASFGTEVYQGIISGVSKIAWYENDGKGGFSDQKMVAFSSLGMALGASVVHPAHLDTDNQIDVLWGYTYDDDIFGNRDIDLIGWSRNNGDEELFSRPGNGLIGIKKTVSVQSIYAADLDCDGDMDALSASRDDDTVAWYENDGNGTFSDPVFISKQADGASAVYAADLDGDGDMDVLSTSLFDGKIAWYENLIKTTTSIEEPINNDLINIYPNPFNNFISIQQVSVPKNGSNLLLFDVTGRHIQSVNLSKEINNVSTAHLGVGLYFYKIISADAKLLDYGKLVK